LSDSPVEWNYLDLADCLIITEAVLGVDAQALVHLADVGLAESALGAPAASFGDIEFYPDFATKAAVLCRRLAKNHPLPDGNKRVAFLCTVEFVERNGFIWEPPSSPDGGVAETVQTIEAVAAGELEEEALAEWIAARLRRGE
jgi:death on curing protein